MRNFNVGTYEFVAGYRFTYRVTLAYVYDFRKSLRTFEIFAQMRFTKKCVRKFFVSFNVTLRTKKACVGIKYFRKYGRVISEKKRRTKEKSKDF